ncbi:TRM11 family SAM-dependent methyltransferase [Bacillus coahuilensis]|uniref:TRM11 family SAM-dependent methyltransferase n=1 Tax=Bacillus coahuilensis TaxID=408580 RepID=UPI00030FF624|nr:RsmD family RNA methyltransferase [Bacillus coahuilensis]
MWLNHQKKPHQYSTALSTRVARAVVNIAAPSIEGTRVIDPCCGIGTVLIEALSMGINIIGSDNNPLVMKGIRENLAYFGYECDVRLRDLRDIQVPIHKQFDAAVIDLPYNLCSVITSEDQLSMLKQARLITKRLIIVTVENVKPILKESGFLVKDEGKIVKGSFIRHILVCE